MSTTQAGSSFYPVGITYDGNGRPKQITQGQEDLDQRIVRFDYDPATGYLQTITDPLTQVTTFERDPMGRVTATTLLADPQDVPPVNSTLGLGYDGLGNMTKVTPPGHAAANDHTLSYTPRNLLDIYTPPPAANTGKRFTKFVHNWDRQLTKIERPDGVDVILEYDDVQERIKRATAGDREVIYNYDPVTKQVMWLNGPDVNLTYGYTGPLLSSETWGGDVFGSVQRSFNNDFILSSERINDAHEVIYTRDNDGLPTHVGAMTLSWHNEAPLMTGRTVGEVSETIVPNAFGETESLTATAAGATVLSVTYDERDHLGRIKKKTESIEGETAVEYEYSYDHLGRLWKVWVDSVLQAEYTYDGNGNRLNDGANYDDQDRLTDNAQYNFTYTANGELKSKTDKTTQAETLYTHDGFGSLTGVTLPDGRSIQYLMDARGRRVGKKVDGTLEWGLLYRSALQPVAELDAAGAVITRFVYATSRNIPDYAERGDTRYAIITDHLGSLRLVVDTSSGEVVQRMEYDAWGRVIVDEHDGFDPLPFGFAGGIFDRDTGLVRFGARDYDPSVGRWVSKDPILFGGGDSNLYGYVGGDGVNGIDITGRIAINLGGQADAAAGLFYGIGAGIEFGIIINLSSWSFTPYATPSYIVPRTGGALGASWGIGGAFGFIVDPSKASGPGWSAAIDTDWWWFAASIPLTDTGEVNGLCWNPNVGTGNDLHMSRTHTFHD